MVAVRTAGAAVQARVVTTALGGTIADLAPYTIAAMAPYTIEMLDPYRFSMALVLAGGGVTVTTPGMGVTLRTMGNAPIIADAGLPGPSIIIEALTGNTILSLAAYTIEQLDNL
jgi:hypothetical protein